MNKAEREELKDKVMDFVLVGKSYRWIANKLGIGLKTVNTYVQDRRKAALQEIKISADETLASLEQNRQKRVAKLWEIALDPKCKKADRNRAIQLLQQEDVMDIKKRQLLGLLPAEAPVVAIQNNNVIEGVTTIADSIRRLHPELIDRFSHNKAQKNSEKEE